MKSIKSISPKSLAIKLPLLFSFLQSFLFAYSQGSPADSRKGAMEATLPVVVMPAPNSATLTRIVSENVDLYTGKLGIDIPLYTLKSRNIEVPISLQTCANSHKVNDIATWTGLGWNMNAGGLITRVMKNLPDEFSKNISGTRSISPSFNFPGYGFLSLADRNVDISQFNPMMPPFAPSYTIDQRKDIIHHGNWNVKDAGLDYGLDMQPDEFYFNFGTYSGKFVFEPNGNVRLLTEANLSVTYTISNGKITDFTIITDDGYKYEFGNYSLNAVEESKLKVQSKTILFAYQYLCSAPNYPYSFKNIKTGASETILTTRYWYSRTPLVMSYLTPYGSCYNGCSIPPGSLMDFWHPWNSYNPEYPSYPSTWFLTRITSPTNDIINFSYSNNGTLQYLADRSFNSGQPEFGAVCCYMTGSTCSQNFHRGMELSPGSYFSSAAPPKQNTPAGTSFTHYPSFGYYNISANTIELISKRLKDITTSQGYKVEFIASTPRNDLPGDKQLDKLIISKDGTLIKEFDFVYETAYNTEAYESIVFNFYSVIYNYGPGGFISCSFQPDSRTETGAYLNESVRSRIFLKSITEKGAGQESLPPFVFDYYNKENLPFRTSMNQDCYGFAGDKDNINQANLSKIFAGVLKTITYPTGGNKEFIYDLSGNANAWNGLKIIQVKESVGPGSIAIVKNYTYGTFCQTDQAITSYAMPDVIGSLTYVPTGVTNYYPIANKTFTTSGRVNPEASTHGAAGGYSYAEVSQPGNGKYRVEFTTVVSNPDQETDTKLVSGLNGGFESVISMPQLGFRYPFPQKASNDWQRGLPVAEYYKREDGTIIKSVHYEYDFDAGAAGNAYVYGMLVTKYRIDYGTGWNWMIYGRYPLLSRWQLLKAKTDRDYHSDGTTYLENRVEISYGKKTINNKEYLFQTELKNTGNSKNEQVVQRLKYPLDYSTTSDAFGQGLAQLKAKKVYSAVVEKYQFIQDPGGNNKRYTEGVLNKFHADKPLVKQSYIFQPSSATSSFTESNITGSAFSYDPNYRPVLNFNLYDAYGNIQEQNEESDVKETFIWNYNNSIPVAKVTNAAFNEVAYTSFEADGQGNWNYNQNLVIPGAGVTGKKIYNLDANGMSYNSLNSSKSYVLSFWAKGGTPRVNVTYSSGATSVLLYDGTPPKITIGQWSYFEVGLSGAVNTSMVKWAHLGDTYVDEVRLHPADAQMVTYTFDPLIGMTSQCDPNNRVIYYEYDGLQRLKLVRDQYGNVVKTYEYNYKQ